MAALPKRDHFPSNHDGQSEGKRENFLGIAPFFRKWLSRLLPQTKAYPREGKGVILSNLAFHLVVQWGAKRGFHGSNEKIA